MTQQVKAITAQRRKPAELSSIPRTDIKVEGKGHLHRAIDFRMHIIHPYIH